jgi:endonuclease/exonuclease/phosphatase family metal-dependent hydrolase
VRLTVRSWNLYHGNTVPLCHEDRLERMVRLATADEPEIVCLQELPVWALERLDEWSGMTAVSEIAQRPTLGPIPSTAELGYAITRLNHGLLRSAFTGQANAILVAPALRVLDRFSIRLNPLGFRRAQARWLGLPPLARLAWAKEGRVCHAVRVALPGGGTALVANLHATFYRPDERLADAECLRAAVFVDAVAEPVEPCVLAGDFNVRVGRSRTLRDLLGDAEWGFAGGGPGVDHVLARGPAVSETVRWPDERRRDGDALLSDHAPVEAVLG